MSGIMDADTRTRIIRREAQKIIDSTISRLLDAELRKEQAASQELITAVEEMQICGPKSL